MTNYYRNWTRDEFEVQYNARLQVENSANLVAQNEMLSDEYRAIASSELDISFGERPLECLDLFLPENPDGAPVHLFIHGGYWRSRTKEQFSFMAKPLVEAGAVVAVTSYTLCPDVRVSDIAQEMVRAVTWLYNNVSRFGANPQNIHVSGHSAGGHLAAMLAVVDWPSVQADMPQNLIKSSVPVSGLFELAPVALHSINDTIHLDDEQIETMSPTRLRPSSKLNMHVYVGGDESESFQEQSRDFAAAWGPHVGSLDYDSLEGHNHFMILGNLRDEKFVITQTFLRLMGLSKAASDT